MDSVRDGVGSHRLEHRNMEDWVDCTHAVWEPKSVRPGASSGDHFERAKVLFSELLQRLSGAEELCFDKHMRTNSKQ